MLKSLLKLFNKQSKTEILEDFQEDNETIVFKDLTDELKIENMLNFLKNLDAKGKAIYMKMLLLKTQGEDLIYTTQYGHHKNFELQRPQKYDHDYFFIDSFSHPNIKKLISYKSCLKDSYSLNDIAMITRPWELERLYDVLSGKTLNSSGVARDNWNFDRQNHFFTILKPWNIVLCHGGKHSSLITIINPQSVNSEIIVSNECDYSNFLNKYKIEKNFFVDRVSGEVLCPCILDIELQVVYELGKEILN